MGVIRDGVAAPRQQEEGQRAWSEVFRLSSNVSPPNRAHSATPVFASRSRDGGPQRFAEEAADRRVRRLALRDLVPQVVDLHMCPRLRELASGVCTAWRARLACVPGCISVCHRRSDSCGAVCNESVLTWSLAHGKPQVSVACAGSTLCTVATLPYRYE